MRISIHAAREGGDRGLEGSWLFGQISIHAAREGGDQQQPWRYKTADISIHAAREGGDSVLFSVFHAVIVFQSTPPVKAATVNVSVCKVFAKISIHAAREGGDTLSYFCRLCHNYFNPRRP